MDLTSEEERWDHAGYAELKLRPICEPIDLPPGAAVLAEHVACTADAPASSRLLHFHDVCELVLFGQVEGSFLTGGRRYALHEGSIIFVPSMQHHDFDLAAGAKAWTLIQIDPYVVEQLALQPALGRLKRAFCVQPSAPALARIRTLADWLVDEYGTALADGTALRLVELLLIAAADAPDAIGVETGDHADHIERLLPALERLRAAPGEPVTMVDAARLCHLSAAYFSRRFRQVFGMNFSAYSRAYRLHLAARRIATSRRPVAEIGYMVGFASPSHFTQCFHKRFGVTPSAHRNGRSPKL